VPAIRVSTAFVASEALGFAVGEGVWIRVLPSASLVLAIPKKLPIPEPLWLESGGS
jgi:hypothetical protein